MLITVRSPTYYDCPAR